jgi:hypothetical protein
MSSDYIPDPQIAAAIKQRLSTLLQTDRPTFLLGIMVKRKSPEFPGAHYSTIEDQVMQEIILKYKDRKLDRLWHLYNVGYFELDTKKFLEQNSGGSYENLQHLVRCAFVDFLLECECPRMQAA